MLAGGPAAISAVLQTRTQLTTVHAAAPQPLRDRAYRGHVEIAAAHGSDSLFSCVPPPNARPFAGVRDATAQGGPITAIA